MLASDAFVAKCAALFFSLYMCEEDGNVDWDFPALDPVWTKSKSCFLHVCAPWLFKGTVSRDGYFFLRSKHFIQYPYFLCTRWWFSRSFESFSLPYTIVNFLFASLKLLTNFEYLIKNLLRILFSVIGRCSLVLASHWLQGIAQELIYHRRLPVWFYRITGGFQCQNHHFRVFEVGYWKDF